MFDLSALPADLGPARLRPLSPRDAAAFADGTDDDAVREFAHLPEPSYTEKSVLEMIDTVVAEGLRRGDLAVLAIADRESDDFAGSLVLFDVDAESGSAELGFWISARHRRRGLARAAVELGVQFARAGGIVDIRAHTVPANVGSHRVLSGQGFRDIGKLRGTAPSGEVLDLTTLERRLAPRPALPIRTDRLVLRPHEMADTAWFRRVYGDEEFVRFLLHGPWSDSDTESELAARALRTDLDGPSRAIALVVAFDGEPVGDVSLTVVDDTMRVAEIGWAVAPEFAGRGFAAEASRAMLELAFEHYRCHRVVAQMDARNTGSAALAERVGMRRETHHRQDWWNKGEWTDTLVFASLADDR